MTGTDNDDRQDRDVFGEVIAGTLNAAVRLVAHDPALLLAGIPIVRYQKHAAAVRQEYEKVGIIVPAVMMISLTSRCNLACKGCYQRAQHRNAAPDMTADQVRSVISQAEQLGVSVIVFAGGEPLIRKDEILALAASYPSLLFAVFTNGLLIDEDLAIKIAATRNIVPVISFEGRRAETDLRRGSGVFGRLVATCSLLKERGVFFGCSITASRSNFDSVLDREFVRSMIDRGARAFIYVEYVPIEPGTEDLVLTDGQRSVLGARLSEYMEQLPALFIGFPGDEETFGGCLAAGRGFVHVSPSGDLEPCPAAPFSDVNLVSVPLKDALSSQFLASIRVHHDRLTETKGGCALWTNREWVQGMLGRI